MKEQPDVPSTEMSAPNNGPAVAVERTFYGLLRGFRESTERFGDRPALLLGDQEITYKKLYARAGKIAAAIAEFQPINYPLCALLAARDVTAYEGILGILASGKGYVPLNPKFPIDRSRKMLLRSGARVLIASPQSQAQLPKLLEGFESQITVILPESSDAAGLAEAMPHHRFVVSHEIPEPKSSTLPMNTHPDSTAYFLFTSGSTGEPKGVPISHSNACAYVRFTCDRYEVNERDRLSQEFDLTFDLSVHDMFVAWERGACVCCVPDRAVMAPAKFIRDTRLTMWFSVPSVVGFLSKMRLLTPGCFPTLRWSLFCGEPLPAAYAQQWQESAPHSIVENLYGPTETTIAITQYRWDKVAAQNECLNGIVPIGWPFDGQQVRIVGEDLRPVPRGESGELCLAGSQVTSGYWNDPQRSAQQFVRLPEGGSEIWYRTGDLVKQWPDGCLHYAGRVDNQVKVRGYRVELQEIEGVLRQATGSGQVAAVPWPISNGTADGIVAFVAGVEVLDAGRVLDCCRSTLPDYMVPRKIHRLEQMPLNANGKMDRKRLVEYLEEMQS